MPYCAACGKEILPEARFCPHCGASVTPTTLPVIPYQSQQYPVHTGLSTRNRNIIIAVVGLGAVGLVVIVAVLFVALSSLPNMALTNFDISVTGSSPNCTANYSFTLVNNGGRGFATVNYMVDNRVIGTNNYLVQARGQLPVTYSLSAPDCAQHYYSVEIVSQRPA